MGKKARKLWNVISAVSAFMLTFSVGATVITSQYSNKINGFLGIPGSELVETGETGETPIYYRSNFKTAEEVWKHNSDVAKRLEAEGAALLKNDNKTLPLAKGAKVTVFGRSSVDLVKAKDSNAQGVNIDLKTQFETNGNLQVNPTLYEAYKNCGVTGTRVKNPGGFGASLPTVCNVLEAPMSVYTEEVRASYATYKDAAIVVIARDGGEGADPNPANAADGDAPYLALQSLEKEMIQEAVANFDKVIVLVNSSNMMELGELDALGVDACMLIGGPGGYGMLAVADMLVGNTNPSGKLANIYASSSLSAPAMQNFGDFTFTNVDALNAELQEAYGGEKNAARYTKYVVYSEGIYVGYKYYETRYEDVILNRGNASDATGASTGSNWNYDAEVVYPFGYGLSYTTFEQKLKSTKVNGDKTVDLTVTVTNTGSVKGKSVVEIYGQSEYTQFDKTNKIEKAAVQLVGFEKTKELAPAESVDVVVNVDLYQLATYDEVVNKGYILEEGDYYLALGDDSHDALNNILAAKKATGMTDSFGKAVNGDEDKVYRWTLSETDTESFKYSEVTKHRVTNLFEDADLNYYMDNGVTYLSRQDWKGTYPTPLTLTANQKIIDGLKFTYTKSNNTDTSQFKTEQDNGLTLAMLRGADYEDSHWEQLLDQMTVDELLTVVARACKIEIASIGKPLNYLQDTPTGINKGPYYEQPVGYAELDKSEKSEYKPPQYPTQPITAGTWNKELLQELGDALGEDGMWLLVHHHYAPGANIHRTPYSGRNFEYYSEDGFLSSEMSAYQVRGARMKGLITYIKHFVTNDQEMNRTGVSTFMNEQTLREIYLRGFEGAFTKFYEEGNSTNAQMGAFNRIGTVWSGAYKSLMTDLLTNEWGFHGISDTDFAMWTHMEAKSGIMAGTTDFAVTNDARASEVLAELATDADLYAQLRESAHRNLYVIANSQEMNGITATMKIVPIMTWYTKLCYGMDLAFATVLVISLAGLIVTTYSKKEEK